MGLLERVRRWWDSRRQPIKTGPTIVDLLPKLASIEDESKPAKPWLVTPCRLEGCERDVTFFVDMNLNDLEPFKATVIVETCPQCHTRWAAVIPPVYITEADSLVLKSEDLVSGESI
jgi:hypothetical protein